MLTISCRNYGLRLVPDVDGLARYAALTGSRAFSALIKYTCSTLFRGTVTKQRISGQREAHARSLV